MLHNTGIIRRTKVMMVRLLQSLLALTVLSSLCSATTQICDRVIYDGKEYSGDYEEFPLEDYWSDKHPKPDFLYVMNTACWRGYIATWEVRNDTLFLKALSRWDNPIDDETPIPLQSVFPDKSGLILANWYSGVLHCNRGKDFNERLFFSIHNGKIIGLKNATKEQLNNPSYEDLTWSSLLTPNKSTVSPRTRKWQLRRHRWIDGDGMFSWDGPLKSVKSFRLRGIFFPGGKLWTAPNGYHFVIEAPDSVRLPTIVTPVEVAARVKHGNFNPYRLSVSNIEVLPVGSVIQGGADNLEKLIGELIVLILIVLLLVVFGIIIFRRKVV